MRVAGLLVVVVAVSAVATTASAEYVVPKKYPLFRQCDPAWSTHFMGGTNPDVDTICDNGCAMSSLAMALAGKGYRVDGAAIDPDTLNEWLRRNKGYTCIGKNCNNLVLDRPNSIAEGITYVSINEKPPMEEVVAYVDAQNPIVIAHVNNRHHFVLVIGYETPLKGNNTVFLIHDPGDYVPFTKTYSEMAELLLYKVVDRS